MAPYMPRGTIRLLSAYERLVPNPGMGLGSCESAKDVHKNIKLENSVAIYGFSS